MTGFWRMRRPGSAGSVRSTRSTRSSRSIPYIPYANGSTSEALSSIFGDEEVSDVILEGNDGGSVLAVKAILAARSPYFRHTFYANSSFVPTSPNEKERVVFKEWDCCILNLVVEYCFTDNISVMKNRPTEDIAKILAVLRIAANDFNLPHLLDKIHRWIERQVRRNPGLACAMIEEGMRNDDIDEVVLQVLRSRTKNALLPNERAAGSGVLALSKPGLLFLLRSMEDHTSHFLLLQAIDRWVEGRPGDKPDYEKTSRQAFGRKCATRFIKLSKIPKEHLEAVIKRSELYGGENSLASSIIDFDKRLPERPYSTPTHIKSYTHDSSDSTLSYSTFSRSMSSVSSGDRASTPRNTIITLTPIEDH